MAKKKNSPWDDVQAVPRSDIPIGRRGMWRAKLLRLGLIALIPLNFVACVVVINDFVDDTFSASQANEQQAGSLTASPGQGEAKLAVDAWITSQAETGGLAGAELIGWSGSQEIPGMTSESVVAYGHDFDVNTDNLGVVQVQQIVFEDKATGAISASSDPPSISVATPGADVEAPEQTWTGFTTASADDGVDSAITGWARAWTSGDSESVRVAMRDPDTGHAYSTLSGVEAVEVNVVDVATREVPEDASEKEREEAASWGVARVEVTVLWSDTATSSSGDAPAASDGGGEAPAVIDEDETADGSAADSEGTTFTVDVRLADMATGTPTVTAWGAAGTGPDLTDYENAYSAPTN